MFIQSDTLSVIGLLSFQVLRTYLDRLMARLKPKV